MVQFSNGRLFFLQAQDVLYIKKKIVYIKQPRLVVFDCHFGFLPFEIQTLKTSGFRMFPVFQMVRFQIPTLFVCLNFVVSMHVFTRLGPDLILFTGDAGSECCLIRIGRRISGIFYGQERI